VCGCVDSLEKKIKCIKEHMQNINPTVLMIYDINPPVRDITCSLTVASAMIMDVWPSKQGIPNNLKVFLIMEY
jgi:hypothetical protein